MLLRLFSVFAFAGCLTAKAGIIIEEDFSSLVDQSYTGQVMTFPSYGEFNSSEGQIDLVIEVGFDPADNDKPHALWSIELGNSTLSLYFNADDRGLVFYHFNPENPANTAKDGFAFLFGTGDLNWKQGERHTVRVQWLPSGERSIWVDGTPRAQVRGEALFVGVDPEAVANAEQRIGGGNFRLERFCAAGHADAPEREHETKSAINPAVMDFTAGIGITRNASGDWQLTTQQALALIDGGSGHWIGYFDRTGQRDLMRSEGEILVNGTELEGLPEIQLVDGQLICRYINGIAVTYQVEPEAIIWGVELPEPQAVDDTITFSFPAWPGTAPTVFVPHYTKETALDKQPTLQAIYGEPGHLSFPLVSIYSRSDNLGWSCWAPLELDRKVFFEFNALTDQLFQAVLRVTPYSEAQTRYQWKIRLHEGDFRPGLGAVFADSPEAFRNVEDLMGFSQIGGDIAGIPNLAAYGLRYRVVNTDTLCGGYGLWVPEERDAGYEERSEAIRSQIRELHQNGVKALLYAQGFETHFEDMARERFADSILRAPDGTPKKTPFGIAMDPYHGESFRRHILQQIELLLEEFPEADGFFWDWSGENRQKILIEDVSNFLHARGKYLVGNNAYGRTWRFMDNVLAECSTRNLRTLQYLGLAYPITYLPVYYGDLPVAPGNEIVAAGEPQWAEKDFKACLATGNFMMYQYRFPYHDRSLELLRHYLPLWEAIRERRWVFEANPLELPEGYDGNIFALPDGGYAVTMTADNISFFEPETLGKCQVKIRVHDISEYTKIRVLSADDTPLEIEWFPQDGAAYLKGQPSAAVLILQK